MADTFKPKRGRHSTLYTVNPILEDGEVVFEKSDSGTTGSGIIKMGDGHTRYNDLPAFIAAVTDYVRQSTVGKPNGVCPLNIKGYIDVNKLPPAYAGNVVEYPGKEYFPAIGDDNVFYIDTSTTFNNLWRWDTNKYVLCNATIEYRMYREGNSLVLVGTDGTISYIPTIDIITVDNVDPDEGLDFGDEDEEEE